ncbi:MAG: extracellular solute-binding protein, partial [Planctomycetota bacterium]
MLASSDYTVINALLFPEYAEWNIKFAANEMVIAFRKDSHRASQINKDNWHDILLDKDVTFGRSDPNADPCGYRAVLTTMLAESFYKRPGLSDKMLAKDQRYIRPKEVDLLALLEVGELDYMFIYRSVAEQHNLFITKAGEPIIYGVTIPNNAPNRKLAMAFLTFLLETDSG